MPSKSKVCFYFSGVHPTLRDRARLKGFIESIFKKEKRPLGSINYIFCTDNELLKINQDFLNHDYFTDIITFDLSEGKPCIAEVYISVDRVRDNANKLGVSFKAELHRVIFHGVLHLCGYMDKSRAELEAMRQRENYYLNTYF